jgi:glycosyltransferase involved in cell wall biosynthesis
VRISVTIAAYQADRWIAEALDSILAQTRPPDEVIVVDDGSTDGTATILAGYARRSDRVRVARQDNRGAAAAFNRAFDMASGDFVALCGADDVWRPHKLEWQAEAIAAHPDVDVLFGHAEMFGVMEGDHARPPAGMTGRIEAREIGDALFAENFICAPSVLIRRALFERLGPFVEDYRAEDYEYWLRCRRAGACFHYDPRTLLGWRQHGGNASAQELWMDRYAHAVRDRYAADVADRQLVRRTLAPALFRIARALVDAGQIDEARAALRRTLRYGGRAPLGTRARALAWLAILALPTRSREQAGQALVRLSRAFSH